VTVCDAQALADGGEESTAFMLNTRELLLPISVPGHWRPRVRKGEQMYTRHDEVPVFEYRDGVLDAVYYNHVQVALNRLGESLRLSLPKLKTLELILQRDAWIIVDRAYNDLPVAAWTNFDVDRRDALHAPVHCQIRLFHANAGMLLKRVLEAMELLLGERLELEDGSHQVIDFPGKE
jgi:hypothetical protein